MAVKIQVRRGTAAQWTTANPILSEGEWGVETDTRKFKIGDGSTAWTSLLYSTQVIPWGNITGTLTDQVDLVAALALKQDLATRVQSTASTATLTPNVDSYDMAVITAQAEALAIAAPTGTPSNGNAFVFRIKDNGTARALTFSAIYRAIGSALPTTTTISKTLYFVAVYNSIDTKWDVFPSNLEV